MSNDRPGKEEAILEVLAENNRLKEKLDKIITQLYSIQDALNKSEADKAEAVKMLNEMAKRYCIECHDHNQYCENQFNKDCPWIRDSITLIEKLTGKPFSEVGR